MSDQVGDSMFMLLYMDPLSLNVNQITNDPLQIHMGCLPKLVFTFSNAIYILDNNSNLYHVKGGNTMIVHILSDVRHVESNKYCILALKRNGELWVIGKDDRRIGILGLGNHIAEKQIFEKIPLDEKVKCISMSDTYAVGITHNNDVYIWGTTLDHFFGSQNLIQARTLLRLILSQPSYH